METIHLKPGDTIGQRYRVERVLGVGGFGIVYLVTYIKDGMLYALKTFRDELLIDQDARERFRREASIWIELGLHPNLVRASWVEQLSGRLYIGMEYIEPNQKGLNSLEGYLKWQPPDLNQSLDWAIQICQGMEYAFSRGIRAHRDVKPANLLITRDGVVKISDFGLAGVLSGATGPNGIQMNIRDGRIGLSGQTIDGVGFGTPTHMAPEQFSNASTCNQRSDIYSFGVVLYQLATGGKLPYLARTPTDGSPKAWMVFWQEMKRLHTRATVPRVDSPLFPILQHCLAKDAEKRYATFREIRLDLESLPVQRHGVIKNVAQEKLLSPLEWSSKGYSLQSLGRFDEALKCFESALEIDASYVYAWDAKADALYHLGRYEEAISCVDQALRVDPNYANAYNTKGNCLTNTGCYEEALEFYDRALRLAGENVYYLTNKGKTLYKYKKHEEAIRWCDQALKIDSHHSDAWFVKGASLYELERHDEALHCYNRVLDIDPGNTNAWINKSLTCVMTNNTQEAVDCCQQAVTLNPQQYSAWLDIGMVLQKHHRYEEAFYCYQQSLKYNPFDHQVFNNQGACLVDWGRFEDAIAYCDRSIELSPEFPPAWKNKGLSLYRLGRFSEALNCVTKGLELDPGDHQFWNIEGVCYYNLGRDEDAIQCFNKALQLAPTLADGWYNKAVIEDRLKFWREAIHSYQQYLRYAPTQEAIRINKVQQRLQELGE